MQRLSSGLRVNSAKDDAAGLSIAERMNSQIRGMSVAIRNANDGISLAQTAEGGLGEAANALQRMRELAVQSRNGSNNTSDKDSLNLEFQQLTSEVTRVLSATTFNGKAVLAAGAGSLDFQVGANTTADDLITLTTSNMLTHASITAITAGPASIGSNANTAALKTVIDNIDGALEKINSERAMYGSAQNRFNAVISNLQVASENQSAARSRIMDADYASETANLSRAQILQQAGTAMVSQANQLPQQVLKLLGN
jgi:flagellin